MASMQRTMADDPWDPSIKPDAWRPTLKLLLWHLQLLSGAIRAFGMLAMHDWSFAAPKGQCMENCSVNVGLAKCCRLIGLK
jgi:hypothetical protein